MIKLNIELLNILMKVVLIIYVCSFGSFILKEKIQLHLLQIYAASLDKNTYRNRVVGVLINGSIKAEAGRQ